MLSPHQKSTEEVSLSNNLAVGFSPSPGFFILSPLRSVRSGEFMVFPTEEVLVLAI